LPKIAAIIKIGTKIRMCISDEAAITPAENNRPSPGKKGNIIKPVSKKIMRNNTK
jgi:hypothetical protein